MNVSDKLCEVPACNKKAEHWYVHTGSGIRYLCHAHFASIHAAAEYRGLQIAHGTVTEAIPLEVMRRLQRKGG